MKIGILGAGRIAGTVANTLRQMPEVSCYAVASRDLARAEQFAADHGFSRAYGSYVEMLSDPEVELVYIATPHSHHMEHALLCISYGKHVLCEKAFTLNADQARKVAAAAEEKGVYVAEAIWTRYMPSRRVISDVLAGGVIGTPNTLTANLSYVINWKDRIMRPELAGGALLDIGIYGINFALMTFGWGFDRVETAVRMTDTGVDAMETITLFYPDGRMAVLTHSIYCRSDRKGIIHGDKGYMVIENINDPQSLKVYDLNDRLVAEYDFTDQISGYEFEFLEARRCIAEGKPESESMPLSETIRVMEFMDSIRKAWGIRYPQEG